MRGTQSVLEIDGAENRVFKVLAKDVFEMFVNEGKGASNKIACCRVYLSKFRFQFNKRCGLR